MLEIKIKGGAQQGKTNQLIKQALYQNENAQILFVCATAEEARRMKDHFKAKGIYNLNISFCGAGCIEHAVRARSFSVVILDNLNHFPNLHGGEFFDYVSLAKSRIINQKGVVAYSLDESCESIKTWVSTSKWYKPWTWGAGYITESFEYRGL